MSNCCNFLLVTASQNNLDDEKDVSSNNVMELSDGEEEVPPSDTVEVYELPFYNYFNLDSVIWSSLETILSNLCVCPISYS